MDDRQNTLPRHVEETARAVEQLHVEHHERATRSERFLEHVKARVSQPVFVVAIAGFAALWIVANFWLHGRNLAWDPPPFAYLELVLSTLALFVTILILATQRRADILASHREQLILQLVFVSEQKTAKIIALLEEQRRDSPQLRDRVDREAEQMTETVDPRTVSEALRNSETTTSDTKPG
jgi:uncharacterized membrane protein